MPRQVGRKGSTNATRDAGGSGKPGAELKASHATRLETVDALRGIASLSVAWFHLTNGNGGFLADGWLKRSGAYGWVGVEVFFVISGFIIPYSLHRSGYRLRDFRRFTFKRLVRLDPPYLVNIALVLMLGYLSTKAPGFRGQPFEFSAYRTALHLGYLNAFVGEPWINVVYWTLAIEFQFYLLIGVLFSLVASQRPIRPLLVLAAFSVLAIVVKYPNLIFHFAFLFSMGIAVFRYKAGMLRWQTLLVLFLGLGVASYFQSGLLITAAGLFAAIVIAFINIKNRLLAYLGLISYSLYLVHVPIGGRIVNFGERLHLNGPGQALILFVALTSVLMAAVVFYHLVEKPAQRWSSAIKIRPVSLSLDQKPLPCEERQGTAPRPETVYGSSGR